MMGERRTFRARVEEREARREIVESHEEIESMIFASELVAPSWPSYSEYTDRGWQLQHTQISDRHWRVDVYDPHGRCVASHVHQS